MSYLGGRNTTLLKSYRLSDEERKGWDEWELDSDTLGLQREIVGIGPPEFVLFTSFWRAMEPWEQAKNRIPHNPLSITSPAKWTRDVFQGLK